MVEIVAKVWGIEEPLSKKYNHEGLKTDIVRRRCRIMVQCHQSGDLRDWRRYE